VTNCLLSTVPSWWAEEKPVFLWDPLGTILRSGPVSLIRAVPDGVGNVTSQPWNSPSCSSLAMLVRGIPSWGGLHRPVEQPVPPHSSDQDYVPRACSPTDHYS
jgi:hypothetical protein